jgi:hypothetical protein
MMPCSGGDRTAAGSWHPTGSGETDTKTSTCLGWSKVASERVKNESSAMLMDIQRLTNHLCCTCTGCHLASPRCARLLVVKDIETSSVQELCDSHYAVVYTPLSTIKKHERITSCTILTHCLQYVSGSSIISFSSSPSSLIHSFILYLLPPLGTGRLAALTPDLGAAVYSLKSASLRHSVMTGLTNMCFCR